MSVLFTGNSDAASPTGAAPKILVFGDSLSAGYGIDVRQGWVALLQQRLSTQGYGYEVVNASVSGETTAGGRARLERALAQHKPAVVILELGGNDGLRGLPIPATRANLAAMVDTACAKDAKVLVLGIEIPPNYGGKYVQQFAAIFGDVAREKKVPLVPFILDGVALDTNLMQQDGIHPNISGQPRVLDNVWPALKPLLAAPAAR